MGTITLGDQQQRRALILQRLCAHNVTIADAARLLNVTERHARRLKQRFMADGIASVPHGNTGRTPANKTDLAILEQLQKLAGPEGPYNRYNTCHLAEVLARDHEIVVARSTLDRLLVRAGLRKRARPGERVVRRRRKRRAAEGAMIQLDGSPHEWLGEGHDAFCLLGGIDDATGKVVGPIFRPTEDQAGYLLLLRQICTKHGLPMSVYHDKHTILRSPKKATIEDELAGTPPRSQVGHVLARLGIEQIVAHSPQAKGRIERLWKTLQDRLSKELLTAKVKSIDEANAFLPAFIERYNATFAREPAEKEPVWTALEPDMDLDYYFSTCETRVVKPDHTVTYGPRTLQLLPGKRAAPIVGQKVEVHGLPNGAIVVYHNRAKLSHKELAAPPPRVSEPKPKPAAPLRDPEVRRQARRRQTAYLFAQT